MAGERTNAAALSVQPLHPSMLGKLDPEYIAFHNAHVISIVPPHTLPWDPAIRNAPTVPGASEPLPVGSTRDIDITHTKCRVFTPQGQAPEGGWPGFVWFHGGGWTLGSISSETPFCTNMCVRAKCVVISVDYRLAPEHPYPTAVDDAVDALQWVVKNGAQELGINLARLAVGGSSSGGNLAAILALKAASPSFSPPLPSPLIFQLLHVPVTDNTASIDTLWAPNADAPWLTPERMLWFKRNYLPDEADWAKWDASPLFAPDEMFQAGLPKAWVGVAELDILREEGIAYAEKMRRNGVEVEVKVYKGAPHPFMAMDGECLPSFFSDAWMDRDQWLTVHVCMCVVCMCRLYRCGACVDLPAGVLSIGRQMVTDAAEALHKAFYG